VLLPANWRIWAKKFLAEPKCGRFDCRMALSERKAIVSHGLSLIAPGYTGRRIGSISSSTRVTVIVPEFYVSKTQREKRGISPSIKAGARLPTLVMAILRVLIWPKIDRKIRLRNCPVNEPRLFGTTTCTPQTRQGKNICFWAASPTPLYPCKFKHLRHCRNCQC